MVIFDFIYYIGYNSGKRNGFKDSPSLYGKIILAAIIYFLYLSFQNFLKLVGYKFIFGFSNLNVILIALSVIFALVFFIYNERGLKVSNRFSVSEKMIRIYFNFFLWGSLIILFLTTITVGPQV